MRGFVKVHITVWEDEAHTYCIDDELEVDGFADLTYDDNDKGYYENLMCLGFIVEEHIQENFKDGTYTGCGDYEWYIIEDSFKEYE